MKMNRGYVLRLTRTVIDKIRQVPPKTWGVTVVLALVAVVLIVIGVMRKKAPLTVQPKVLANVEVMEVVSRRHKERLVLPARIEADRQAVISSELGGRLEKWLVAEGALVEAGQVVAKVDTADLQARLGELEAQKGSAASGVLVATQQVELAKVALKQAERDASSLQLELDSARADKELAAKEFGRVSSLVKENIASEASLDQVRNRLTQATLSVRKMQDRMDRAGIGVESRGVRIGEAQAALAQAQARVKEVERQISAVNVTLSKGDLRAPFTGRLEEYLVEAGEVISPGVELARLYDLSHVRVLVDVADRYAPFLESDGAVKDYIAMAMPGARQSVSARLVLPGLPKLTGGTYAGLELPASLVRLSQAADPLSNTFRVELRLVNPGQALKQGMIARAEIEYLEYPDAIVIPVRAVQVSETGPRVLVVERQGEQSVVTVRDIEPVSISGQWLLVGSGLTVGDQVITAGGKGVVHGEEVVVLRRKGGGDVPLEIGDGIAKTQSAGMEDAR